MKFGLGKALLTLWVIAVTAGVFVAFANTLENGLQGNAWGLVFGLVLGCGILGVIFHDYD